MRRKLLIAGAAAVALAAGGVGIARAVGEGDDKVTGPAADRAGAAAVDIVGGGRVTGVEREDDDGAAWEVEVVKSDGSKVEVELDAALRKVATETEDDGDSGAD